MKITYSPPLKMLCKRLYEVGHVKHIEIKLDRQERAVLTAFKPIRGILKQSSVHVEDVQDLDGAACAFWHVMKVFDRIERRHTQVRDMQFEQSALSRLAGDE